MKIDEISSDKNDLESEKNLLDKKLQFATEKVKLLESELENTKSSLGNSTHFNLAETMTVELEQKLHRLEKENEILRD